MKWFKPIKIILNLLPDFCLSLPILDLISDKMPSWREFQPYVFRLRKSLQCQLLLKSYRPSSSYINTHTPLTLRHMHTCVRILQYNTHWSLVSSECMESILLAYFCVSHFCMFVQQMQKCTADWKASKPLNFEKV